MKTYYHSLVIAILLLLMFSGCARLLPSSKTISRSPWEGFNDAKLAYEKIVPGVTNVDDLKRLGFDPYLVPNIKIMNVTEIINLFLPNSSIKMEDLDLGLLKCINSKDRCTAYQVSPSIVKVNRIGNFWLDALSFKRHTINTGWEFRGLITIVDDVVTYRDPPGGRPLIYTEQIEVKPLGPLQETGGVITSGLQKVFGLQ
ncbi:MAG: hypothetical protein EHM45_12940 [Desulfobacteraceae bacterium]|nr:MAG: hypothetical protein EHM45_12940 [Desulfobacteraceae bacterium]